MAARRSFRDRFYTPPVARAVTSPSAMLAAGAGAAVGIVATAPLSIPLAVAGAIAGAVVGYGGRVALAIPKADPPGPKIDPFQVDEPWRRSVLDAVRARARYDDLLSTFTDGPLRSSVVGIGQRLDEAVDECWIVAQQGHRVVEARKRIDEREIGAELGQVMKTIPAGAQPNETQSRTIASLNAQLATAQRMDALAATTMDQLRLLNARLDEAVTQAIELSVTNRAGVLDPLDDAVEQIVDDLHSLQAAFGDLDGTAPLAPLPQATPPGTPQAGPTA